MARRFVSTARRLAVMALVAGVVAGCQSMGGSMAMEKKSLYDRLGGQPAIVAVVDDFVGNVAADNRINGFFARTDIPRLKRLLVEQI